MSVEVERLTWDSEFFGFPIGRVTGLQGAAPDEVRAAEEQARGAGLRCLYGELDAADAVASYRLQELGWRFVEAATLFSLSRSAPPIPVPPDIEIRLGGEADLEGMGDAIAKLGAWSRYAVDPHFGPEPAQRMQDAWVRRAATDPTGEHELLVAETEDGITAFITRHRSPVPTVDGVATTAQGSGAARALIEVSREWAGEQPLMGGPIAARNVHSLRYVANCGYKVASVTYKYHRWLDEEIAEVV